LPAARRRRAPQTRSAGCSTTAALTSADDRSRRAPRHRQTIAEYSFPKADRSAGGVQAMISKADILILTALALSFVLGVYLFFSGHREQGIFAATWVVAILCFGIYCKLLCQRR
jgi:hypothetical protein